MLEDLSSADVVVVGAGLGGLVCGAHLAAAGRRVVVVDRHSVAGGNATVFTHHGHEFDVGVHYLPDCGPTGDIPAVLAPLGIEIDFAEMDPDGFDTFVFPQGQSFRVPKGVEAFRRRLHATFPDEGTAIDRYIDLIVGIDDVLAADHGRPAPPAPPARRRRRPSVIALSQAHPRLSAGLVRILCRIPKRVTGPWGRHVLPNLDRTLEDLFDEIDASPRLRTVLGGQHGLYALPPSRAALLMHAAVVMHYLHGAYYPVGGGQVIADRLAAFIRDRGGEIVLRTPVEAILVSEGRVQGVDLRPPSPERARGVPDRIAAPVVVSNADLRATLGDLVGPGHLPEAYRDRVAGYEMALPLFVIYLVLDRDLRAEGLPNTNLWVLPDDDLESQYALLEAGEIPAEPIAWLTFASLKDPTNERLCRPGQTNLQVMTLAPRDHGYWGVGEAPGGGERYRLNPTYATRKRELRDRLLTVAERGLPGLVDAIVHEETATPITHERFVRSSGGTSYGIAGTPAQFALNRPAHDPPVSGLYLVGSSTVSGHGISAAMTGGVKAANAVLGAAARGPTVPGGRRKKSAPLRQRADRASD